MIIHIINERPVEGSSIVFEENCTRNKSGSAARMKYNICLIRKSNKRSNTWNGKIISVKQKKIIINFQIVCLNHSVSYLFRNVKNIFVHEHYLTVTFKLTISNTLAIRKSLL